MKGMATCKVCGRDFALMNEEHYVVCDPKLSGVLASLVSNDKAYEYDAFDCPHCGCQFVAQTRKPKVVQKETYIEHLEHTLDDGHGCDSCKYEYYGEDEEPCNCCIHCTDESEDCKYERKSDEEKDRNNF